MNNALRDGFVASLKKSGFIASRLKCSRFGGFPPTQVTGKANVASRTCVGGPSGLITALFAVPVHLAPGVPEWDPTDAQLAKEYVLAIQSGEFKFWDNTGALVVDHTWPVVNPGQIPESDQVIGGAYQFFQGIGGGDMAINGALTTFTSGLWEWTDPGAPPQGHGQITFGGGIDAFVRQGSVITAVQGLGFPAPGGDRFSVTWDEYQGWIGAQSAPVTEPAFTGNAITADDGPAWTGATRTGWDFLGLRSDSGPNTCNAYMSLARIITGQPVGYWFVRSQLAFFSGNGSDAPPNWFARFTPVGGGVAQPGTSYVQVPWMAAAPTSAAGIGGKVIGADYTDLVVGLTPDQWAAANGVRLGDNYQ